MLNGASQTELRERLGAFSRFLEISEIFQDSQDVENTCRNTWENVQTSVAAGWEIPTVSTCPEIQIDPSIDELFPPEFYLDPQSWLQKQPDLLRKEAMKPPCSPAEYDFSRVKLLSLKNAAGQETKLVCKKLKGAAAQEIARAQRAYSAGIPTPRILGQMVLPDSSTYILMEHINGLDLHEIDKSRIWKLAGEIINLTTCDTVKDLRKKNVEIDFSRYPQLYRLWRQNRHLFSAFTLASLLSAIRSCYIRDQKKLKTVIRKKYPETDKYYSQIPALLGFQNIETALEALEKECEAVLAASKRREKPTESDFKYTNIFCSHFLRLDEQVKDFIAEGNTLVNQIELGFDPDVEIEKLRQLCLAKGIEHKDLNWRNILVEWDFENDRPLCKNGQSPKLYIIDWEVEDHS
jgi:hypothetical protein